MLLSVYPQLQTEIVVKAPEPFIKSKKGTTVTSEENADVAVRSDLSAEYLMIRKRVAFYLGYGLDPSRWMDGTNRANNLDLAMEAGIRQFASPPIVDFKQHEWSFMKPLKTLVTDGTLSGTASLTTLVTSTISAVQTATALFSPHTVDRTLSFSAGSGNSGSYTVLTYVNSQQVYVSGADAADETGAFTVTDNGEYLLPPDFGWMEGRITFANDESYASIPIVPEGHIREKLQWYDTADVPRLAAIKPVQTHDAAQGQQWKLVLWPTPDATYNLTYKYSVEPAKLAAGIPFPRGGLAHSETIIQSCIACAEGIVNRVSEGPEFGKFLRLLAASISRDRQGAPETIGYVGDPSTIHTGSNRYYDARQYYRHNSVTVNGTQY